MLSMKSLWNFRARPNKKRKVAIIGPLPEPIGGVSTFVHRLIKRDNGLLISRVVDPYTSHFKAELPHSVTHDRCYGSGIIKWLRLVVKCSTLDERALHFNFSTARSLLLLALIIKGKRRWLITLHNGRPDNLGGRNVIFRAIVRTLLKRVDIVFCLSSQQRLFYDGMDVSPTKIVCTKSYIYDNQLGVRRGEFLDNWLIKTFGFRRRFVISGYPKAIYRIKETIEEFLRLESFHLSVFLYGTDSEGLLESFLEYDSAPNISVFYSVSELDFNSVLAKSDVYLRPNLVDSFGIAVADSINLGLQVFASDVCERYPGVQTFSDFEEFRKLLNFSTGHTARMVSPSSYSKDYIMDYHTAYEQCLEINA